MMQMAGLNIRRPSAKWQDHVIYKQTAAQQRNTTLQSDTKCTEINDDFSANILYRFKETELFGSSTPTAIDSYALAARCL
jgi:hypothetical protein